MSTGNHNTPYMKLPPIDDGSNAGSDDEGHEKTWLTNFIIIPEQGYSEWFTLWELFTLFLLLLTAYYQPYVVAVVSRKGPEPAWCEAIGMVLDIAFSIDMILQFFISYPHSWESKSANLWERRLWKIAARYCSVPFSQGGVAGWFWIDLMSVLPGWMQRLGVVFTERNDAPFLLLRLLRLFRLGQLVKVPQVFKSMHAHIGFPIYLSEFSKFFIISTLASHIMACTWCCVEGQIIQGAISYQTDQPTWLTALIGAKGDNCVPSAADNHFCAYLLAHYWAMMTITSVGYGDIVPQNQMEYTVAIIDMLIVGYIWAYIVGSIVSLLSSIDPHTVEFKQQIDELNEMVSHRNLPKNLQFRLRSYMHGSRTVTRKRHQRNLLEHCISEGLQREVARHDVAYHHLFTKVYYISDLESDAVLDMVRGLKPFFFGPSEVIMLRQMMLVVQDGLAAAKGRVLTRGNIWGQDDILLESRQLCDGVMPRTLTHVSILGLNRQTLLEVCVSFPMADRRIRRAQIRTAVFRAFCHAARAEKARVQSAEKGVSSKRTSVFGSFARPGEDRLKIFSGRAPPMPPPVVTTAVPRMTRHIGAANANPLQHVPGGPALQSLDLSSIERTLSVQGGLIRQLLEKQEEHAANLSRTLAILERYGIEPGSGRNRRSGAESVASCSSLEVGYDDFTYADGPVDVDPHQPGSSSSAPNGLINTGAMTVSLNAAASAARALFGGKPTIDRLDSNSLYPSNRPAADPLLQDSSLEVDSTPRQSALSQPRSSSPGNRKKAGRVVILTDDI